MSDALDPRAWQGALNTRVHPEARVATRITFVSQEVDETTAFAALQGEKRHGNEFVEAALEMGAPFVLTDLDVPRAVRVPDAVVALRSWARAWREASRATLVGITGSAGKTTAKELVAAALEAGKTPASLNTLNYLACYLLSHVSPRSLHVIEMGIDRIGEMDELVALVNPDIGVVTNVGPAHLEFFGSLDCIAREKGRILNGRAGLVSSGIAWRYPEVPSYGFDTNATHRATNLELTDESSSFGFAGQSVQLSSPSHKVAEAAVLALTLAQRFDVPLQKAAERIAHLEIPGGRMRLERGRFTLIDDTYNANPLSIAAALETLERLPERHVAVLGDMRELGENASAYHEEMGRLAARAAQLLIAVGQHAADYARGARDAGLHTLEFANAQDATNAVLQNLQPRDAVLVKGSRAVGLERVAEVIREQL
jgi:UDP-N-acetylmuramoyl-tripeptide--D-alanyl-D-alanine ligase